MANYGYYGQNLSGIGSFAEGLASGVQNLTNMKLMKGQREEEQRRYEQERRDRIAAAESANNLAKAKEITIRTRAFLDAKKAEQKQKLDEIKYAIGRNIEMANSGLLAPEKTLEKLNEAGGMISELTGRQWNPLTVDDLKRDEIKDALKGAAKVVKAVNSGEMTPEAGDEAILGWIDSGTQAYNAAKGVWDNFGPKETRPVSSLEQAREAFRKGEATPEDKELLGKGPKPEKELGFLDKIRKRYADNDPTLSNQELELIGKGKKKLLPADLADLKAQAANNYENYGRAYNLEQDEEVAYQDRDGVTRFYRLTPENIAQGLTAAEFQKDADSMEMTVEEFLREIYGVDTAPEREGAGGWLKNTWDSWMGKPVAGEKKDLKPEDLSM